MAVHRCCPNLNVVNEQQVEGMFILQTVLYLKLSRNIDAARIHTRRHSCACETARQRVSKPIKHPVQGACSLADASPLWSAHPNIQAS